VLCARSRSVPPDTPGWLICTIKSASDQHVSKKTRTTGMLSVCYLLISKGGTYRFMQGPSYGRPLQLSLAGDGEERGDENNIDNNKATKRMQPQRS
jgi:hypothetical protein